METDGLAEAFEEAVARSLISPCLARQIGSLLDRGIGGGELAQRLRAWLYGEGALADVEAAVRRLIVAS